MPKTTHSTHSGSVTLGMDFEIQSGDDWYYEREEVSPFIGGRGMDVSKFAQGNSNWLNQADLTQPYQLVTIAHVGPQMVGNPPDEKLCFQFRELAKPYAANTTAVKRIIAAYGTDASQLIGKQLVIYRSMTSFQGAQTLCIRLCTPHDFPYQEPGSQVPETVFDAQGMPVAVQPLQPAAQHAPAQQQPAQASVATAIPQAPASPVQAQQAAPAPVQPPWQTPPPSPE